MFLIFLIWLILFGFVASLIGEILIVKLFLVIIRAIHPRAPESWNKIQEIKFQVPRSSAIIIDCKSFLSPLFYAQEEHRHIFSCPLVSSLRFTVSLFDVLYFPFLPFFSVSVRHKISCVYPDRKLPRWRNWLVKYSCSNKVSKWFTK